MAGITVAHHDGNQDSFAYQHTRRKSVTEEQISHFLAPSPSSSDPSVEDLTTEMQEYMLRETMAPWLGAWSADQSNVAHGNNDPTFGAQGLFDLEQLFVPDEQVNAELYDEITFVPEEPLSLNPAALSSTESTPVASPQAEAVPVLPSTVAEMPIVENRKRRRSSCSSSEDEDEDEDSSSESETEQVPYQACSYSNNNNNKVQKWARYSDDSSSSDSDSESEDEERPSGAGTPASIIHESSYAYMHKRQMEETLLQKITQQLHQDKLPGILSILSSETSAGGQNSDEVEIDLSRLARDQLVRLLCYVEACIVEQNGGPAVNLSDYVAHSPQQQPAKRSRPAAAASIDSSDESDVEPQPRQRRRRRQRQGRGTTSGKKSRRLSQEDEDDDDEGPISMASLTKRTRRKAGGGRGKKSDDTAAVVSNSALDRIPRTDSIAVTRPKRRAALQKKNQFEDVASDIEGSDDGTLIVFGDEQMDFRVTDNKTIVHESSGSSNSNASAEPVIVSTTTTMTVVADDDDDEDEEIDIML